MKTLTSLPNEIILDIGKNLDQEDVENFSSTCRHLREIGLILRKRPLYVDLDRPSRTANFAAENPYFSLSISSLYLSLREKHPKKMEKDVSMVPSTPSLDTILNELRANELIRVKGTNHASLGNDHISCALALLTMLKRLEHLELFVTTSEDLVAKWSVLELIANGQYCQRLKTFTYHQIYGYSSSLLTTPRDDLDPPSTYISTQSSAPTPTLREIRFQTPLHLARSPSLEKIYISTRNCDLEFLKYAMKISTSLKTLSLHYTHPLPPVKLSELGDILRLRSNSIRDMMLDFTIYMPKEGLYTDEARLGSMEDFRTLQTLSVPVDALLGYKVREYPLWSHLLPSSLQGLCLEADVLSTEDLNSVWSSGQILDALLAGIPDLRDRCPVLEKMCVRCLEEGGLGERGLQAFRSALAEGVQELELVEGGNINKMFEIVPISPPQENPDPESGSSDEAEE